MVTFVVHTDGSAGEVHVSRSSGVDELDSVTLGAVRRAAPFPPPPDDLKVSIPISYQLADY